MADHVGHDFREQLGVTSKHGCLDIGELVHFGERKPSEGLVCPKLGEQFVRVLAVTSDPYDRRSDELRLRELQERGVLGLVLEVGPHE